MSMAYFRREYEIKVIFTKNHRTNRIKDKKYVRIFDFETGLRYKENRNIELEQHLDGDFAVHQNIGTLEKNMYSLDMISDYAFKAAIADIINDTVEYDERNCDENVSGNNTMRLILEKNDDAESQAQEINNISAPIANTDQDIKKCIRKLNHIKKKTDEMQIIEQHIVDQYRSDIVDIQTNLSALEGELSNELSDEKDRDSDESFMEEKEQNEPNEPEPESEYNRKLDAETFADPEPLDKPKQTDGPKKTKSSAGKFEKIDISLWDTDQSDDNQFSEDNCFSLLFSKVTNKTKKVEVIEPQKTTTEQLVEEPTHTDPYPKDDRQNTLDQPSKSSLINRKEASNKDDKRPKNIRFDESNIIIQNEEEYEFVNTDMELRASPSKPCYSYQRDANDNNVNSSRYSSEYSNSSSSSKRSHEKNVRVPSDKEGSLDVTSPLKRQTKKSSDCGFDDSYESFSWNPNPDMFESTSSTSSKDRSNKRTEANKSVGHSSPHRIGDFEKEEHIEKKSNVDEQKRAQGFDSSSKRSHEKHVRFSSDKQNCLELSSPLPKRQTKKSLDFCFGDSYESSKNRSNKRTEADKSVGYASAHNTWATNQRIGDFEKEELLEKKENKAEKKQVQGVDFWVPPNVRSPSRSTMSLPQDAATRSKERIGDQKEIDPADEELNDAEKDTQSFDELSFMSNDDASFGSFGSHVIPHRSTTAKDNSQNDITENKYDDMSNSFVFGATGDGGTSPLSFGEEFGKNEEDPDEYNSFKFDEF